MSSTKVLLIGYLGYVNNQIDGQTIKTRSVLELLQDKFQAKCKFIDTQSYKTNKIVFLKTLYYIIHADYLIYLGGKKNLLYLFPIFHLIAFISNTKIIYPLVGGWLDEFIQKHKYLLPLLKNTEAILSESSRLKENLEIKFNLTNVHWFPNFRKRKKNNFDRKIDNKKFRIVFYGRIIKEKGIETIFRLEKQLVELSDIDFEIDFYGPIIDKELFTSLLKQSTKTSYKGVLEGDNIYNVLNLYNVMLLPTQYEGEGFPGSIIDAYTVGLPVICTNWKFLPEIVKDQNTGFVYDYDKEEDLLMLIKKMHSSIELQYQMSYNAYKEGLKYSEEVAWSILSKFLK